MSTIAGANRSFAEQSVAAHPNPSAQEIQDAEKVLKSVTRALSDARQISVLQQPWFPPVVFVVCLILYVALPALLAALCFRGGLVLRVCGLTVVRPDGSPATRVRLLWRAMIAWSPLLLACVLFALFKPRVAGMWMLGGSVLLLMAAVTMVSLLLPARSLQDRLAGTWLVPR